MARVDGLASGFDTTAIINSILNVQRIPINRLENQIVEVTAQKTAFLELSARMLSVKTNSSQLGKPILFDGTSVTSSNESILTATTQDGFSLNGSFQFSVEQLATADQYVSSGFSSSTQTLGVGQVTIEVGNGGVSTETELSQLNGGQGISLGSLRISDKNGGVSDIDLTSVLTVDDVIQEINNAQGSNVTAALNSSGDGIEITDNSGGSGSLTISDLNAGSTATDLGIVGTTTGTSLGASSSLYYLSGNTSLSQLNDGRGVRTGPGSDVNILLSDGVTSVSIDLDAASTIQDVLDAINASDPNLSATISTDGKGITVSDSLGGGNTLTITDGFASAATDLGIENSVSKNENASSIEGRDVLSGLNTVLLSSLNGGSGVVGGLLDITDRQGNTATIDISSAQTLQDVIEAINSNGVAQVSASVNGGGSGLEIRDSSGGTGSLIINENGSTTAASLGIENGAGVSSNTVNGSNLQFQYVHENTRTETLNGGLGVDKAKIKLFDKNGNDYTVSLAEANNDTIGSILEDINGATGGNIVASLNANGDGIVLTDFTGGSLDLRVEEVDGSTARDLNLLQTSSTNTIDGSFEYNIDIVAGETLDDLSRKINEVNGNVNSSILNDGSSINPFRLNLISKATGSDGRLTFDFSQLGIDLSQTAQGQDAVLLYGSNTAGNTPLLIRSSSNTINNVLPGLDLELHQASSSTVTLNASTNYDNIATQLEGLVDGINGTLEAIDNFTKFNADTFDSGLLLGDSTVRNIENSIQRNLSSRVAGLDTTANTLAQYGVRIQDNGRYTFDKSMLLDQLETNFEDTKEFFTRRETITNSDGDTEIIGVGFAVKFEEYINSLTNTIDGTIQTKADGFDSEIKDINVRIDSLNERVLSLEERLVREFANLEVFLGQANATMDRLTQSLVPLQPRGSN